MPKSRVDGAAPDGGADAYPGAEATVPDEAAEGGDDSSACGCEAACATVNVRACSGKLLLVAVSVGAAVRAEIIERASARLYINVSLS
jgi:hypothetical protein